jgi:hypothetical protein
MMHGSDAEFYQNHRDDPEEWGEAVRPKAPSRRLASMISVRFSPDEAREVRAAAAAAEESVSTFVRNAALSRARQSSTVATTTGGAPPTKSHVLAGNTMTYAGLATSVAEGFFVAANPQMQARPVRAS